MGVTKRAGRKKDTNAQADGHIGSGAASGRGTQPVRAVYEGSKKKEVGVSDLTLITKISNEAINENLKLRFENAIIYTYIGEVLVSVNPFRDLGIYTDNVLASYKGKTRLEVPPHVFAVAEAAYKNMRSYHKNQCVIISGESGAGKTEAAKRIMQYISSVAGVEDTGPQIVDGKLVASTSTGSGGSHSRQDRQKLQLIEDTKAKVLATNPLLESFGNAKTLRNNNSSRFGKYLELQFNANSEPVGAKITNYLLEKSRVVGQIRNERNFHIFYQFTKAATAQHREQFALRNANDYLYLSQSQCMEVDGINDVADFSETMQAMDTIRLEPSEKDEIFRMLAAILWIGNVTFQEDKDGNSEIAQVEVTNWIAELLSVDPAAIVKALTLRVVETSRGGRRGSVYEVPLNITQATAVRDALAKSIYFNLFDWIVLRVNEALSTKASVANSVGILDIYGFEIFERNSFEQLCINYVNEKLQQIFIELTLRKEQETYEREQIQWTPIKYFDNKIVCDLIEEKRPPGVFAALNDACATAHADSSAADQTFVQRLNALSSNPHFQPRQGQFVIKHYAGDVNYSIASMTDKNKDQLLKDLLNLVGSSRRPFVHTLFPNQVNQDDKRRPPTAGDKIKKSANELVETLRKATPSYIRTIKPNDNKSPTEYNTGNIVHQIKYLGLQENVRIRRAGFAYRRDYQGFCERFFLLSKRCRTETLDINTNTDFKTMAKWIMVDNGRTPEDYQMGTTMMFIKTPETTFLLEYMRDRFFVNMFIRIQRAWRNYLRYRIECATRIQRFWRKASGGGDYQKDRDYGHTLLQGRKERRRFSLLGSRRFLGDYLGVNNVGGFGEVIRRAINLSNNERALFSCRCDLLVTKFGRSSKPEARILLLTARAVYIVLTSVVNKQVVIQSERSVALNTIKYVSTSRYRDDWFSLGIASPQEPDPLIECMLKAEFFVHLKRAMPQGALDLRINEHIEYNKKPGKPSVVKVVKDPAVNRVDFYKSGTIHTSQGEAANSISRPTPKPKPKPGRPVTQGKLLKPGGPSGRPSQSAGRSAANSVKPPNSMPASTLNPIAKKAIPSSSSRDAVPAAAAEARNNPSPGPSRNHGNHIAAPPPPPPLAPPPPTLPAVKNAHKALYDFNGQSETEISIVKDEVVEVLQKEAAGWWLVRKPKDSKEGWAPSAYLEEIPPARSVPAPPPPPHPIAAAPLPKAGANVASSNPVPSFAQNSTTSVPIRSTAKTFTKTLPTNNDQTNSAVANGAAASKPRPTPPIAPKRPNGTSFPSTTDTSGGLKSKPTPPPHPRVSQTIPNGNPAAPSGVQPGSIAGSLAEMLRKREASTRGPAQNGDDDEDDAEDDW